MYAQDAVALRDKAVHDEVDTRRSSRRQVDVVEVCRDTVSLCSGRRSASGAHCQGHGRRTLEPPCDGLADAVQPFAPRVGADATDLLVQLRRALEDVRGEQLRRERAGDEVGVLEQRGDLERQTSEQKDGSTSKTHVATPESA